MTVTRSTGAVTLTITAPLTLNNFNGLHQEPLEGPRLGPDGDPEVLLAGDLLTVHEDLCRRRSGLDIVAVSRQHPVRAGRVGRPAGVGGALGGEEEEQEGGE